MKHLEKIEILYIVSLLYKLLFFSAGTSELFYGLVGDINRRRVCLTINAADGPQFSEKQYTFD